MNISLPREVLQIINTFKQNKFEAFIVGGCVRDLIIGNEPKDFDITTNAMPEDTIRLFEKTVPTGIKHGTITVIINDEMFEVTTYRVDGQYSDSRHPEEVFFTRNIEEDLSRRDFTINAMAYNYDKGMIDLFGGKDDINKKIIKTVGDANKRFNEDALRILRAIRFATVLNFEIEQNTYNEVVKNKNLINNISVERIREEFNKILISSNVKIGLKLLKETGIIQYIFKNIKLEIDDLILKNIENSISELHIRLAILLSQISDEKHILNCLKYLKYDNSTIKGTIALIKELHTIKHDISEVEIKQLINRLGKEETYNFLHILKLKLKYINIEDKNSYNRIIELDNYITKIIQNNEPIYLKDLNISGNDLIELGCKKGKSIGEILNILLLEVYKNPTINEYNSLKQIAIKHI